MSKEISKSPEMLEKEARIEALRKQIKKERTTLKRLKTRLANTKQEITEIQRNMMSTYYSKMSEMAKLKEELIELLKKCKKIKGLNKDDKQQIDMLVEQFGEEEESEAEFNEYQRKVEEEDFDFDEEQRAKMHDIFMEFQVKPDEKEQRNIRKVFIKLSTHFHPDKARNAKDAATFHTLMQQINQAYEFGDIDKLLEIEQIYLLSEDHALSGKAITVDLLQQEIERLERDYDFIKNQVTRTSGEIKQLRASDMGSMLTQVKQAEKHGVGLGGMTEEIDEGIETMQELRDALKASVKSGSLEPLIDLMMSQSAAMSPFGEGFDPDDLNDILNEMFADSFEEDEDREPIENPTFPIGSSVRVESKNDELDWSDIANGWEGRVKSAFSDEGHIYYEIEVDSVTIKTWNVKKTKQLFVENEDFGIVEIHEINLQASKPRDTPEEAIEVYRRTLNGIKWTFLGTKNAKEMQSILLTSPTKTDIENWEDWFSKNKVFPVAAKHKGLYNHRPGQKTMIRGLYDWHDEGGFLVLIESNGFATDHPLTDLEVKGKYANAIELYAEWLEQAI